MPVKLGQQVAILSGLCTAEEAEPLWEWLRAAPRRKVNLKGLRHPHTAVLQVLMALRPEVSVPPQDEAVASWLLPALGVPAPEGGAISEGGAQERCRVGDKGEGVGR